MRFDRAAKAAAAGLVLLAAAGVGTGAARADNLYDRSSFAALSTDRRASAVGDALTIVIFQAAEAANSAQNNARRQTNINASIVAGSVDEQASLDFGGSYNGRGEAVRSERLVAQITVVVEQELPNGDLDVVGEQFMHVNGERTRIALRGRVRPADIDGDNRLLSSRIADAQIDYNGRGFVTRSAAPGLIQRIFGFLGIG